jgi:radical SAM superfamily enzyme YgiQ (UPF0313 family)
MSDQQHFDSVVIGEAELLMDEDFILISQTVISRSGIKTSEQHDLTRCRIPRYDLLQLEKYSGIGVMASKGCAFDCDFCSSRLVTGKGFRHKTVEQVINEIRFIQKLL